MSILFIPLKTATRLLGLKDTRVTKRLILNGDLQAKTVGRRVLVSTASLAKFAGVDSIDSISSEVK